MLLFLAIWWIEYPVSRWLEYSIPRRNDARLDDTRDRRIGYEEDWPSQEHLDGHEAEPGKDAGKELYQVCQGWCCAAV